MYKFIVFELGESYEEKLFAILSASCLLAGCGSQNLGPLEEKTTKLRDENHKLKVIYKT